MIAVFRDGDGNVLVRRGKRLSFYKRPSMASLTRLGRVMNGWLVQHHHGAIMKYTPRKEVQSDR